MKNSFMIRGATLAVTIGLAMGTLLRAQTVTTTTKEVTSEGTISTFEPNSFVIRSEAAPGPLTYSYGSATRYVDDAGAVVSREVIRSGVPVTVYYTREGDRMLASRVIVHQVRTAAPPAETTTTRTTTTTTEQPPLTKKEAERERKREKEAIEHPERERRREAEHGERVVPAPQTTTTTTETVTTSDGTISAFDPDRFVVKTTADENPVTYRYSKTTEYVDDEGNPVNVDVVRPGIPVTVRYIRGADGFLAHRVIVHRRGPAVRVAPARPLPPP